MKERKKDINKNTRLKCKGCALHWPNLNIPAVYESILLLYEMLPQYFTLGKMQSSIPLV